MIQLLPEPLDGEDAVSGLPLIILALATTDQGICAITVGDEGEARVIRWSIDALRIPWRFDHEKNRWDDQGPLTAMSKTDVESKDDEP